MCYYYLGFKDEDSEVVERLRNFPQITLGRWWSQASNPGSSASKPAKLPTVLHCLL